MANVAQGPGWWLASDGRWYPPEVRPPQAAPDPAVSAPSPPPTQAPPAAKRASQALATDPGTAGKGRTRRHPKGRRRDALMVLVLLAAVLAASAGIAIAENHSTSPTTATSSTSSAANQLAASHHAAQVQAFDQLDSEIRHDIGPCVQQTETVGSMLGILRLLGGSNVTPSEITKLLGALTRAKAACTPATDPTLQQLIPLRVPSLLTAFTGLNFVLSDTYAWTNAYDPHVLGDVQALAEAKTPAAANQAVAAYETDASDANGAATTVRALLRSAARKLGVAHYQAINLPRWATHSAGS